MHCSGEYLANRVGTITETWTGEDEYLKMLGTWTGVIWSVHPVLH